ncbi:MAG TPA: APC family permease, partial [Acidiphilium sp.]
IASVSVFLGSWLQAACDLPNVWWLIIALAGIAVSLPILLRGISASTQVSFILFAVEAVGLAIFAVVVLAKSGGAIALPFHPTGGSPGGFSGLNGIVFATVLFAYVGWENSAGLAEELRNPHRNVPIAVLGSIALILVLYVLVAWATVAGYGAWKGAAAGMTRLGDPNNAAPLVELTDHFMPWFHWVMIVIGVTSACGCYIAALTHVSRWTYASARSGLMPKPLDTISPRSGVPAAAIWFLNLVIAFFVVASYFVFKGNAVTGTAYLAGIGSVPLIVAYLLVSLLCPVYVWRRDRARFSFLRHVLPSVIGVLSVGEAIYVSVQPNQPPPANMFWIYILAILAIAVVATVFVVTTRGEAVDRLGYTVPPDAAE